MAPRANRAGKRSLITSTGAVEFLGNDPLSAENVALQLNQQANKAIRFKSLR
jgi:hypothetical protein